MRNYTARVREFVKLESSGGIVLVVAAIIAMIVANSPLAEWYLALLDTPVSVRVGGLKLDKPLLLWINDGLMAVFFLLVGLEVKREFLVGELSNPTDVLLPLVGAIGGMAGPAIIYTIFNLGDEVALRGWAIPSATDIAFALGVLSLLGKRVPLALKVFLLSLAIFDDLAAIIIIAVFYTANLSVTALWLAVASIATLILINRLGVHRIAAYIIVGMVLWVCVLKSGVHATLAGVVVGLAIPLGAKKAPADDDAAHPPQSPLRHLEHTLHPWVAFMILPIFALANAGVSLAGVGIADLLEPVPLGIAVGLVAGNPIGILCLVGLLCLTGLVKLPPGVKWVHMLGTACLCGIGFTMSLFITSLAFIGDDPLVVEYARVTRLGILIGSVIAAIIGYTILHLTLPKTAAAAP